MRKSEILSLVENKKLIPETINRFRSKQLSGTLSYILESVQREIGLKTLDQSDGNYIRQVEEVELLIEKVAAKLGFDLSAFERDEILLQLEKDSRPFGALQELVDDPHVSDIIVSSYDRVSVQQGRRNYLTDIKFANQQAYENFTERLLHKAGSSCSTKHPIADGMIGEFARLHVVHSSICQGGPYLTIRLNRFSTVAVEDLIKSGLAPRGVFDYLQAIILTGQTLLIAGEVSTGKTTLARALAAAIPADQSILVIEDTAEIQLQHPHVRYVRTREANSDGAGKVTPSECIRAGMRMAMNRIIFGEMRDSEAAESFIDVCASGHPGLSTIHSRNAQEAVSRLELFLGRSQRGTERSVLVDQIATAVQVIVYVDFCAETQRRRIIEIREIGPVADGTLRHREIFSYSVNRRQPVWKVSNRLSAHRDLMEELDRPVVLAKYPAELLLETEQQLEEATAFRNVL